VAGLVAAVISLAQYALGVTLAGSAVPDQATGRVEALYAGLALAISIAVSGVGYLFLIQALAPVAYLSGAALLVWVTGTGAALGTRKRDACPERD
jgi:hypothetical protein